MSISFFIFFSISLSSASGILPPYFQCVEDGVIAKIFPIEEQSRINSNWEEYFFAGLDCLIQTICPNILDKSHEVSRQFKEKNTFLTWGLALVFVAYIRLGLELLLPTI